MEKKKWYTSLLATLTAMGVLFAQWSNFEQALDWFLKVSMLILDRPTIQAVIVSILAGVSLASFLPHTPFPCRRRWSPNKTKYWTRFTAVTTTAIFCVILLQPKGIDAWSVAFPYATLAAGLSSALWTTLAGLLYKVVPKPESLKNETS